MKLQPLGDRVVVKPDEDQDVRTPSGLVIPDTAKEKPQMGTVVAAGPGALDDDGGRLPMDVSEGDKVLYSKFAGTEVKLEGNEYLVLSSRDLLAIVG
jgi:chaperonin GroES